MNVLNDTRRSIFRVWAEASTRALPGRLQGHAGPPLPASACSFALQSRSGIVSSIQGPSGLALMHLCWDLLREGTGGSRDILLDSDSAFSTVLVLASPRLRPHWPSGVPWQWKVSYVCSPTWAWPGAVPGGKMDLKEASTFFSLASCLDYATTWFETWGLLLACSYNWLLLPLGGSSAFKLSSVPDNKGLQKSDW